MVPAHRLKVLSYNSTGLGEDKIRYVQHLIATQCPDIIMLQETWLLQKTFPKLGCISSSYMFHSVSGVNENELLRGRPYGGVSILWCNHLNPFVKRVQCASKRLCAISIEFPDCSLLLVSIYMPCDTYSVSRVSDEFLEVLLDLDSLKARMPNYHIVVGGDWNTDYVRNNSHSVHLSEWVNSNCFSDMWNAFPENNRYTYCDLHQGSFSCIDHWIVSGALPMCNVKVDVHHEAINPSKHSAIVLDMSLISNVTMSRDQGRENDKVFNDRIVWHKAKPFIRAYQEEIDILLEQLIFDDRHVSSCSDWQCDNPEHLRDIDEWGSGLVGIALAADHVFPRRQPKQPLCGWDASMNELKAESIFWHDAWRHHGSLRTGWMFEKMRDAKRAYMYAVRGLKRRQKELRQSRFLQTLANDNSRDFFKEVKKMSPKPKVINCINGFQSEDEIASVFRRKYEALYNSVLSNHDDMATVKATIEANVSRADLDDFQIDEEFIRCAIQRLRPDKADGDSDFNSCHLIYSSSNYVCQLANFFHAMYVHGYLPKMFLNASIVSIPKDYKKSLTDDNNYRARGIYFIALCSSLSKLFDVILLLRNEDACTTNACQFAFKKNHSTSMCTYVLKEIVHSYLCNGSRVYACFLDATKAFDRVSFDLLFSVLVERNVSPLDLRLLLFQYENQQCRTLWQNSSSHYFPISNGVRQGGVASPTLFCMYLDALLERVNASAYGCHFENNCFNCLAYADDLVLLSPTLSGLQSMLNVCENYCNSSKLQFNPIKSACVCFRKEKTVDLGSVSLNREIIPWVNETKHLGHIIMHNLNEKREILFKRSDLVCRTNVLLSQFGSMHHSVLLKIFMSQCAHIYGCQSWILHDRNVRLYYTMFNKCIRRLLKLPFKTHTSFLPLLSHNAPVGSLIANRMLKFINKMSRLDSKVGFLARKSLLNQSSIIAQNKITASCNSLFEISDTDHATCLAIEELMYSTPDTFTSTEALALAHFLCEN